METTTTSKLFQPVSRHNVTFENAIAMAPMTRSRAIDSIPNDLMATYYAQRAEAGLIITEGNSPSPNGLGYSRTPGIYNEEQIAGWKKVTDAVHKRNGKIFTQLMHVGRIGHSANQPKGARLIAPSAVTANGELWTDSLGMQKKDAPEEMSVNDIHQTIREFVDSAKNAVKAGFDGVELHGANGYLIEQFLNPHTNHRNDNYGGSLEKRSRFLLEIVDAIVLAIGKEKVGVRLSPYNVHNDMSAYAETADAYNYLTRELSKRDIIYLHVLDAAPRTTTEGVELIQSIRTNFRNLLILNGGYTNERAESALQNNEADLISFGSSFLANPDLPARLKSGIPLNAPDVKTFFSADEKGYTDYPVAK